MVKIIKKSDMLNSMKIKASAMDKETGFSQEFEFTHSKHSLERANKRGIKGLRLQLALIYGDSIRKQGYEYCILGEDRIPEQYLKQKDKLKNTVVVMDGSSDRIITCYVATDPYRHIKKKSKTLWSPRNVALKKKNMKSYQINTVIHFGKHVNRSLLQVCKNEPSYISWCLINLDHFFISEITLQEIKGLIPDFKLSGLASISQKKKEAEWEATINTYNTVTEDYRHDPYEDYGSSGEVFGWYNGWSDDAIYDAFEGDPDATWNVD